MSLVSLKFVLLVSIVTLVYFIAPKRFQWVVLLVSSYVVYWMSSKWLVLVLFAATLVTFFTGLAIDSVNKKGKQTLQERKAELSREQRKALKEATKNRAKLVMTVGILINLGMLLFLKYFNFFAGTVQSIAGLFGGDLDVPVLDLMLPLGISYYTLQSLGYLFDVYRNKCEADRFLPKFMLFLSFFPQLIQGPIPRYRQLAHQLYEGHDFDYRRLCFGAQLMIWGWMKKVIIADRIGIAVDAIFNNHTAYHGSIVFFSALCYGLQIYTDFSGGIDIVRGVAQILGIELEQNFRQPYFARSIEEFWRRWHITLGAWMRDYVFYPLSLSPSFGNLGKASRKVFGNNVGKKLPAFLSMFIVYFLVGFWHGSSWKYVVYGIWNGMFIMAGILLTEVYDSLRNRCHIGAESFSWVAFQMLRTAVICSMGRFFSRADRLLTALAMFRSVFDRWWDLSWLVDGSLIKLGLDNANWYLLCLALALLFFVGLQHEKGVHIRETIAQQALVFRWAIYIGAILAILIFGIYGPAYDATSFIYGGF